MRVWHHQCSGRVRGDTATNLKPAYMRSNNMHLKSPLLSYPCRHKSCHTTLQVSNGSTIDGGAGFGWFSAVCYLYGRDLYTALGGKIPIGLIASNVGGTSIRHWSSYTALAACPAEARYSSLSINHPPLATNSQGLRRHGARVWTGFLQLPVLVFTMLLVVKSCHACDPTACLSAAAPP